MRKSRSVKSVAARPVLLAACAGAAWVGIVPAPAARADINGFDPATFIVSNNASGQAAISGGTLTITTTVNSQASSAFNNTPQNIGNFTANFTYTDVSTGGADGFAFILQNDPRGLNALGDGGGSIGYGGANPIKPSAAVDFNIYSGNGGSRMGFTDTGNVRYSFPNTGAVDITNGQPVNVTISYAPKGNAGVLTATLQQGANTFTRSTAYNATALAGGSTALVGFSGGTGGLNANQTLSNFTFTSGTATVPAGPYNILQASDTVAFVNGAQFPAGSSNEPGEGAAKAIDKAIGTKYLNFSGAGSGLIVTPGIGPTVITGINLTSANDAPERDPASYTILGSNDGGLTFTPIAADVVPAFSGRFVEQDFTFPNALPYAMYEVLFPTVANPAANNSMQIGEVQLIGTTAVPEPTTLAMFALAGLPLLARRRRA